MAHVSRRLILGALLGSAAGHALANAPFTSLRPAPRQAADRQRPIVAPDAEDLVAQARLTGAVSYVVADAATGQVLEERDGGRMLPCLLYTSAAAADMQCGELRGRR